MQARVNTLNTARRTFGVVMGRHDKSFGVGRKLAENGVVAHTAIQQTRAMENL